jgi:hypothetical protein
LRQLVGREILKEESGVFDLLKALLGSSYGVVENLWAEGGLVFFLRCRAWNGLLVLANIVIGTSLLVDPVVTLVASVWHILLVETPANALVFKEINDRGDVLWDLGEWVTIKTKVITANRSHVVWL